MRDRRDAGFTLIEMSVVALLFGLVSLVVGGILIASNNAERTVRSVSTATTSGQLVTRTVDELITNSSTPLSLTTVNTNDQLLRARVAGTGSALTWQCVGFYYSASAGTIRYTTSSTALGTVTPSSQSGWTLLAEGVAKQGSTPVFQASGTTGVVLTFTVAAGSTSPVAFATTITSRTSVAGSAPCF